MRFGLRVSSEVILRLPVSSEGRPSWSREKRRLLRRSHRFATPPPRDGHAPGNLSSAPRAGTPNPAVNSCAAPCSHRGVFPSCRTTSSRAPAKCVRCSTSALQSAGPPGAGDQGTHPGQRSPPIRCKALTAQSTCSETKATMREPRRSTATHWRDRSACWAKSTRTLQARHTISRSANSSKAGRRKRSHSRKRLWPVRAKLAENRPDRLKYEKNLRDMRVGLADSPSSP